MKKFSKISNYKLAEIPKVEKKEESLDDKIKNNLLYLMDRNLKVQSYGSVDNRFLSGSVKVDGKELLAEAIIDLFTELSSSKEIKALESLKSDIKDWNIIDNKIDEIKNQKSDYKFRFRLNNIIERYKGDDELLIKVLKEKVSKSSNRNKFVNEINNSKLSKKIIKNILE